MFLLRPSTIFDIITFANNSSFRIHHSAFIIMPFDWHQFHLDEHTTPPVVDSRRRLRICLAGFAVLLLVVFGRAVQLEVSHGAAFRAEAAKPLRREKSLPGVRGRILASDGTVLACDKKALALAVHYRYLQQSERSESARRLARLCGLSAEDWHARARRVQARVERIAQSVNRRRADAAAPVRPARPPARSLAGRIGRLLLDSLQASLDDLPPARITVAEELDYHVMAQDIPPAVAARIEAHPKQYPGVKIVQRSRRAYPHGKLAAHVLGHLGKVKKEELEQDDGGYHADDFVGRTGLERQYERLLRGRRGLAVEQTDRSGRVLSSYPQREPGVGRDLVLTLDPQLQQAAETLLDSALERRAMQSAGAEPAGGAIVVMDVHSGALRAAASAPRFDPKVFVGGDNDNDAELTDLLAQADHPLFDRTSRMAIPPGSVFKTISAVALLETSAVDPAEQFFCQGYLHQPDRRRCAVYVRHGIGHGEVTLADALCVSCNVYFFHHCGLLGPAPLVDWALKFGFGRPTGVDLPGEVAGTVPAPATIRALEGHAWRPGDTQLLAVGQGSLCATPLQVVRMMGAVANGGRLVTPHVVDSLVGNPLVGNELPTPWPVARPIRGLRQRTLDTIREGLERVVADPDGTAHGTVYLEEVVIAGKTGTAQTGGGCAAHAWFAGYIPADKPKLAFVVALEHAGDAAVAAGPVAKRLVVRMQQLGMLDP